MAVTVSVPAFRKRHGHASHAVMNGVPVPVVSRFLGQRQSRGAMRRQQMPSRASQITVAASALHHSGPA